MCRVCERFDERLGWELHRYLRCFKRNCEHFAGNPAFSRRGMQQKRWIFFLSSFSSFLFSSFLFFSLFSFPLIHPAVRFSYSLLTFNSGNPAARADKTDFPRPREASRAGSVTSRNSILMDLGTHSIRRILDDSEHAANTSNRDLTLSL